MGAVSVGVFVSVDSALVDSVLKGCRETSLVFASSEGRSVTVGEGEGWADCTGGV